jgi:hypothetical protein
LVMYCLLDIYGAQPTLATPAPSGASGYASVMAEF